DGTWLVSASLGDSRLRIWDVATARLRKEIGLPAGEVRSVAVRPDGRRLAVTVTDRQEAAHLHVYDVGSGERLYSAEGKALAYSPDGRRLAVVAPDGMTVLLLDAQTHETAAEFRGHVGGCVAAAFSPDGRRLATCGRDRTVRVWPLDGGACQVLSGHTDEVL